MKTDICNCLNSLDNVLFHINDDETGLYLMSLGTAGPAGMTANRVPLPRRAGAGRGALVHLP